MSIELLDDDIELWKDEFSAEPWKVISNADVRNIRSPRIYFMQGLYGVIYPLFFDPYHEITR